MFFLKAHDGRNRWWRWGITIAGTLTILLIAQVPVFVFFAREAERLGLNVEDFFDGPLPAEIERNMLLALTLIPFAVALLTLRFFVTRLHKRPFLSVVTGRARFDWRRALIGFSVWFVILAGGLFLFMPSGSYEYRFNPSTFWPLVLIALALIPIQTAAEEIFFRGYLMQGFALLAKNKIVPLIAVTLIFVFIHLANPEFHADYTKGFLTYLSLSMLFGIIAVLDDGLEVPIGIHAANNIFLAVFLSSPDGTFSTYSIFTTPVAELMRLSPYLDAASAGIALCVFFPLLNWRFKTLFEPIAPVASPLPAPAETPA